MSQDCQPRSESHGSILREASSRCVVMLFAYATRADGTVLYTGFKKG